MKPGSTTVFALGILALALLGATAPPESPRIARVVPDVQLATSGRDLNVEGGGFESGSLVYLGTHLVRGVTVDDEGHLRAPVPPGLQSGTYQLRVVSPGHRQDAPSARVTILPSETAPVVTGVSPALVTYDDVLPLPLTVSGGAFREGAVLTVDDRPLTRVLRVTPGRIEALLVGFPGPGSHDVTVRNADGEAGRLDGGITVVEAPTP